MSVTWSTSNPNSIPPSLCRTTRSALVSGERVLCSMLSLSSCSLDAAPSGHMEHQRRRPVRRRTSGERASRCPSISSQSSRQRTTLLLLLFSVLCLISPVLGVKFDLPSEHHPNKKCIWNYALADTLVIVTVNSLAITGAEMQTVDVEVVDGSKHNNVYLSKRDLKGESRMAINTHAHADLGVCFTNTLSKSASTKHQPPYKVTLDLDVDIGAEAVDYNAIANQESLSGLETEMRKLEGVVEEIVNEMDYLKKRELRMKDTNDSTNRRVQNFGWMTLFILLVLSVWQILHLRGFFKRKYLID